MDSVPDDNMVRVNQIPKALSMDGVAIANHNAPLAP